MIEREWPSIANRAPLPDGSSPAALYVYDEDVDRVVERAAMAVAKVQMPAQDQFWRDRTAWLMDPSGTSGPSRREWRSLPKRNGSGGGRAFWRTSVPRAIDRC